MLLFHAVLWFFSKPDPILDDFKSYFCESLLNVHNSAPLLRRPNLPFQTRLFWGLFIHWVTNGITQNICNRSPLIHKPYVLRQNFGFFSFLPILRHFQCFLRGPVGSRTSLYAWQPWWLVLPQEKQHFPHSHGYRTVPASEHHCSAGTDRHKPIPRALVATSSPSFPSTEKPFCPSHSWVLLSGRMREMVCPSVGHILLAAFLK